MDWSILFISLLATIIGLGLGYFIASLIIGEEVARRNLQGVLPIGVLIGILIAFFSYYLSNINFLLILISIFVIGHIGTWFWRKSHTGLLLLNVGQTRNHWLVLTSGSIFLVYAIRQSYLLIAQTNDIFSENSNILLSQTAINWALAILLLVSGLSKLELREKAICFMTAVIPWDEIKSYKWEGKKGNILTIWLKKRFFGLPNHRSLPIPPTKKADIESIFRQYIS
ncbi:MAG: DUF5673 domain-containing protein [Rivularia sp. ALOHA_DT_140]|nr:DUF5673 domain-containing protein [Rivularia sp. ALOHA_DT_140]